MKALKCEICGSTDMVKQGEYYVCQHCSCKYTAEDAKKLMVDVKVEGSVSIDNTKKLKNLYNLARRARNESNNANAANYYKQILLENSNDWEANFYSVYCTAMSCKIGQISSAVYSVRNCIGSTFHMIKNYTPTNEHKLHYSKVETGVQILGITMGNATLNHVKKASDTDPSYAIKTMKENMGANVRLYITLGDQLIKYFNESTKALEHYKYAADFTMTDLSSSEVEALNTRIKNLDPSYIPKNNSSGCYVATAVYGSYDCPQVWTLRRYRDNILATKWYGRIFIHTYYAISPKIVKLFGSKKCFKNIFKPKLDKFVLALNKKGIQNTPYNDKEW
ncbi:MAG: hypothetical protein IJS61_05730 [Firmicutes bacterium]|nr:hypothetical protein [Bacillota bacterium]